MNDLRIRRQRRLVQCAFATALAIGLTVTGIANAGAALPNNGQWLVDSSAAGASVQFTLRANSSDKSHHDQYDTTESMRLDSLA